jgi:hypothetical protein
MQSGVEVVSFHIIECPDAIGSKPLQRASSATATHHQEVVILTRMVERSHQELALSTGHQQLVLTLTNHEYKTYNMSLTGHPDLISSKNLPEKSFS